MALLIKCDICGEYWDYLKSDTGRVTMHIKEWNNDWDHTQRYDLCPRCYDHMRKMVDAAKITFQGGKIND